MNKQNQNLLKSFSDNYIIHHCLDHPCHFDTISVTMYERIRCITRPFLLQW